MRKHRKIAYQGEPGANSHIACNEAYPGYEPLACATFEDAFAAVRTGAADLAMIPIENSLAGRVADIHHLVPREGIRYSTRSSNYIYASAARSRLHIVGEHFMSVHHQLLAPEGATLKSIKTVESHVHALGQCRQWIRRHGLTKIVAADTAGAAREVSESDDKRRAAIASSLAAKIYGLKILARNIEDEKHNTTRFVVLGREPKWASKNENLVVTTFVFEVRNIPAALYKALGGFATNGINMTKLESYMVGGSFSATQFYADVQAHPRHRALELALQELEFVSHPRTLKILGVYRGHRYRKKFE
jgi:prephenate dehydratase